MGMTDFLLSRVMTSPSWPHAVGTGLEALPGILAFVFFLALICLTIVYPPDMPSCVSMEDNRFHAQRPMNFPWVMPNMGFRSSRLM